MPRPTILVSKSYYLCHFVTFLVFSKSYETLLGFAGDRQEVLGTIHCTDVKVEDIICTLPIVHKLEMKSSDEENQFYYQMQ